MRRFFLFIPSLFLVGLLLWVSASAISAGSDEVETDREASSPAAIQSYEACVAGMAGAFPCSGIDLMAHMPLDTIGGVDEIDHGADVWGWTDPVTGHEWALVNRRTGTAFVDISVPAAPVYVGSLPSTIGNAVQRDVKTFGDYALVVSEWPGHGMQIFDLNQLRAITATLPVTLTETAHYDGFGRAHNIVVNDDSNYVYAVGSFVGGTETCALGLHVVDMTDPLNPTYAACVDEDGYTHDAQCVIYHGPDTDYTGHEICFSSNTDTLTIFDVTDKANPIMISRSGYSSANYSHQGWLTDDHAWFLLGDERDEINDGHNTRTYIWDVADLDGDIVGQLPAPTFYQAAVGSVDHNLYTLGNKAYLANYTSGLRIVDISMIATSQITETAFFDVYPDNDDPIFWGAWSVYPYFESGILIVSSRDGGLFVLRPVAVPTAVGGMMMEGMVSAETILPITAFTTILGLATLTLAASKRRQKQK